MPRATRTITVGIASPGGLAAQRDLVERLCTRMSTTTLAQTDVAVRTVRWEYIPPQAGRPQASINRYLDDCDIFLGLLHRRFGESTGESESGFLEEFERALARNKADGAVPHIGVFFKKVDDDELRDAGRDLSRVLAFRKRLESSREVLYGEFSDDATLSEHLFGFLTSAFLQLAELGEATVETPEAPEPLADRSNAASGAPAELVAAVETLFHAFSDGAGGAFDRDRIQLFATSIGFDDELVPVHLANRIYLRRDEIHVTVAEFQSWARTYLNDLDQRRDNQEVAAFPFWDLISNHGVEKVVEDLTASVLLGSYDSGSRRGLMTLLMATKQRPESLWSISSLQEAPAQTFWADIFASPRSRADAVAYCLSLASPADEAFLIELEKRLDSIAGGAAVAAVRAASCSGDSSSLLATEIVATEDLSPSHTARLHAAIRGAAAGALVDVALSKKASETIREFAIQTLRLRKELDPETIVELVARDPGFAKALTVAAVLAASAEAQIALSTHVASLKESWKREALTALLAVLTKPEEAQTDAAAQLLAENTLSSEAWDAVSRAHRLPLTAMRIAREILEGRNRVVNDTLESWRKSKAKSAAEVADYEDAQYRASAMRVIARGRSVTLDASTAELFKREIERGHWFSSDRAIALLAPVMRREDARYLVTAHGPAIDRMPDVCERIAQLASATDLVSYAAGPIGTLATKSALELTRRGKPSRVALRPLLRSDAMTVRWHAARALARGLSPDSARKLVNEYATESDSYFYNVVVAIDETVFGPPQLSELA